MIYKLKPWPLVGPHIPTPSHVQNLTTRLLNKWFRKWLPFSLTQMISLLYRIKVSEIGFIFPNVWPLYGYYWVLKSIKIGTISSDQRINRLEIYSSKCFTHLYWKMRFVSQSIPGKKYLVFTEEEFDLFFKRINRKNFK